MSTITPLMTVEELQRIPDDCCARELEAGVLITMSPAGSGHGGICYDIVAYLAPYLRAHNLGRMYIDTGFILEEHPDTLFGPDLAFIRPERLPLMKKRGDFFIGPPDLAIEVISPTDRIKAVHDKAKKYIKFGSLEVWVVNPRNRTITLYTQSEEPVKIESNEILRSRSVWPGFECLMADLIGEAS